MFPSQETSKLIYSANQLTGFYMMGALVFKGLIKVTKRKNIFPYNYGFTYTRLCFTFPKMLNFQKFSSVGHRRKFSTGEARKSTGDDMKIQRRELTNILRWLKNIFTWLTQKHRNGWVTFKCQKNLNKYCIIKASLRVENRNQYTNNQVNNAVKNLLNLAKWVTIHLS